ncbi:DsbA family protein [Ornithinimicrobium sp. Arc0846-15]|nr:DsbA family protein [Ornithinimicrobium laminariae]
MSRPSAPKASTPPPGAPIGLIAGVVAAVIALIAVVVFLAVRDDSPTAVGSSASLPAGGGVVVNADAPQDAIEVHIFEDFQCPFCGLLENSISEQVKEAVAADEVKMTYTFMTFLDSNLGNDSSSRAANAAVCSSDEGIMLDWHSSVFEVQPSEGAGYTDETFIQAAEEAGLSGTELETFTSCMADGTYDDYVEDMATAATEAGVTSTPTVIVNGEVISPDDMNTLMEDGTTFDSVIANYGERR